MSSESTVSESRVVMSVCRVDKPRLTLRSVWQELTSGSGAARLRQKGRDTATRTHVLV